MVRQYRIERYNGLEVLVCEVFDRYLWSKEQYAAWLSWKEFNKDIPGSYTYDDFRVLLDEWCNEEHSSEDSFFGLKSPIPVINPFPSIVFKGVVQNNRFLHFEFDRLESVENGLLLDEVQKFVHFLDSPHWRNNVARQYERYGLLFESDNGLS